MNRLIKAGVVLMAAAAYAGAQRLDDCQSSTDGQPHTFYGQPSEVLDGNLRAAGYTFTEQSLLSALGDPRADVRSLAASKLGTTSGASSLSALAEALSKEEDSCARFAMGFAIGALGQRLFLVSGKQHPGQQRYVTPSQTCTPSEPQVLTLSIEQEPGSSDGGSGPLIHISARNVSGQVVPFVRTGSPAQIFSITLQEPGGGKARIPKEQEWLYHPISELPAGTLAGGHVPVGMALEPGHEATWDWRPGSDFNMSAPGTYRLSLGGRIEYLDTTACSNIVDVIVADR